MNKPLLHYDVIKTFIVYIAITNFIKSPGISVVASPMQHPMSDSWSSGHQGTLFVPVIPEQPPGLTNQLVHMEPGYAVVSQLVPIVYAHYAPVNIRTTFAPAHRIRKAKIKTLRAPARDLALNHQGASSKPPGAHPTPIVQEDSKKITIELDESEPSSKELDTDGTPRDQIRRCKKKENQEIAQQSLQKDVVENQKPNVLSSSGEIPSLSSQVGEAQTDPLQSPEIMETNKAIETSKMENPTKPDSPEKLQPVLRYEDHKAVPTTTEIWHKVGKKKAAKGYRLPSSTALQNGNHESLLSGKSKELEKQEPGIVQTGDQPKLDHTDEEIKDIGDAKNSNKESDSLDGSQNEPSIDEANRTEMDKLAIGSKSGVGVQRSTKKQTKNRRIQQVMTSEDKKALESFDLLDIFVNKSEKENGKKPKTKKKAASLSNVKILPSENKAREWGQSLWRV